MRFWEFVMKQTDLFEDSGEVLSGQVTLEDVFKAYYECRKTKRRTINALAFELNFEQELIRLWQEINSGAYNIRFSVRFLPLIFEIGLFIIWLFQS